MEPTSDYPYEPGTVWTATPSLQPTWGKQRHTNVLLVRIASYGNGSGRWVNWFSDAGGPPRGPFAWNKGTMRNYIMEPADEAIWLLAVMRGYWDGNRDDLALAEEVVAPGQGDRRVESAG